MALTLAEIEQKLLLIAQTESLPAFVSEAAQDERIEEAAQQSLVRLSLGDDRARIAATVLSAAVRSEMVAGILSDATAGQTLPEGTTTALIAASDGATAPTVVYREALGGDPDVLSSALAGSLDSWSDVLPGPNAVGMAPAASISCMVYCGLCALALADGVPFDEIYFCAICLTCASDV